MMRLVQSFVFVSLAAGLHAGIWALVPTTGGSSAAGGGGADSVTLSAATASQAAMVARWQKAPEISATVVALTTPATAGSSDATTSASRVPAADRPALRASPEARKLAALPVPRQPPKVDVTPALRPVAKPQPPKLRPKTRPPALAATPQQKRRAQGQTKQAQSGTGGQNRIQSKNAKRHSDLQARWGAKIHAKVQRSMRYPKGAPGTGTTKLSLIVKPDGRLHEMRLLRSSGNPRLDKAALRAVRTAGRFSKAPAELSEIHYVFNLSLSFKR